MSTGSKGQAQKDMESRPPVPAFDLPVQEIRRGDRSDVYFWRGKGYY